MNISSYRTIVFDCDGVILDSNSVKTRAFYQAALPYGENAAKSLVSYHVNNGGISRYKKFEYFLTHIVGLENDHGAAFDELLDSYARNVARGLSSCRIANGINKLRMSTKLSKWLIVSGGDQEELRRVFLKRGISGYFDGSIFGSPDTKDEILAREIENKNIRFPALFLGDSIYDHEASQRAGLDFIFVSGWSEVVGWDDYCKSNDIRVVPNIGCLAA